MTNTRPKSIAFTITNTDYVKIVTTVLDSQNETETEGCTFNFQNINKTEVEGDFIDCDFHFTNVRPNGTFSMFTAGFQVNNCRFTIRDCELFTFKGGFVEQSQFSLYSNVRFSNMGLYGPDLVINVYPDYEASIFDCEFKPSRWAHHLQSFEERMGVWLNVQGQLRTLNGTFLGGRIEAPTLQLSPISPLDLQQSDVVVQRLEIEDFHSIGNTFTISETLTGLSGDTIRNVWFDALRDGPEGTDPLFGENPVGNEVNYYPSDVAAASPVHIEGCTFTCSEMNAYAPDIILSKSYFYRSEFDCANANRVELTGNTWDNNDDSNHAGVSNSKTVICEKNTFRFNLFPDQNPEDKDPLGLRVSYCDTVSITRNAFSDFGYGRGLVVESSNGIVSRNQFDACTFAGLYCELSQDPPDPADTLALQIQDNTFNDSAYQQLFGNQVVVTRNRFTYGPAPTFTLKFALNTTVSNNEFYNGPDSIYCQYCTGISLLENTLTGKEMNRGTGISLERGENFTVEKNYCYGYATGLLVRKTNTVTIRTNSIRNNETCGIAIGRDAADKELTKDITIYNNRLTNQVFGGQNAWNYGTNVTWNLPEKQLGETIMGGPYLGGNFWDDYEGQDTDGDAIGDTLLPYTIRTGGQATGADWLPLVTSVHYPTPTATPIVVPTEPETESTATPTPTPVTSVPNWAIDRR